MYEKRGFTKLTIECVSRWHHRGADISTIAQILHRECSEVKYILDYAQETGFYQRAIKDIGYDAALNWCALYYCITSKEEITCDEATKKFGISALSVSIRKVDVV